MTAHLSIGTSTDRINLLELNGYLLQSWVPAAGGYEVATTESDLADYSQPVSLRNMVTTERLDLVLRGLNQDNAAKETQDLRVMLHKASLYFATNYQTDPVYLAAQTKCETNMRYAIIHEGRMPEDSNPYTQPFGEAVMERLTLILERGAWTNNPPGTGTCIVACGYDEFCKVANLEFDPSDGVIDYVDLTSNARLDNLGSAASFSAEAWVRWEDAYVDYTGFESPCTIFDKMYGGAGWYLWLRKPAPGVTGGIEARAGHATTQASTRVGPQWITGPARLEPDGKWHHILMYYRFLDKKIYIAIDGLWMDSYLEQTAGVGAWSDDSALKLYVGADAHVIDAYGQPVYPFWGGIGQCRIDDVPAVNPPIPFHPDERCIIFDASACVEAWIWEGYGDTVHGLADAIDGTIYNAEWGYDCTYYPGKECDAPDPDRLYYLSIDSDQWVNAGSAAAIDDIPLNDELTVDFWINWDITSAAGGYAATKYDELGAGWFVKIDNASGVEFRLKYGGGDYWATSNDMYLDDGWHHVACTFDKSLAVACDIWIDGVNRTPASGNGAGAYVSDAGNSLLFGIASNLSGQDLAYAKLGWMRLSTTARWAADFSDDVPERCVLPELDTATAGLWIWEGEGLETGDGARLSERAALMGEDSGSGLPEWGTDCLDIGEALTSCESPVYISNKRNEAQLTHMFYYDTSTSNISANLLEGEPPYFLLPPVPAVGDILFVGIQTSVGVVGELTPWRGPFCSIVFDLDPAQDEISAWDIDYWNGGWANLPAMQDNTNASGAMTGAFLDTEGVSSFHFIPPTDWATTTVNGVLGWWLRFSVAAMPVQSIAPVQVNRHVYTITWNTAETQEDLVLGDIEALARSQFLVESDANAAYAPHLFSNRVVAGLRSLDRGRNFTSVLNFADRQNPQNIEAYEEVPDSGMTDYNVCGAGRCLEVNPSGAGAAWQNVGGIAIEHPASLEYHGEFHAYMRADANDIADVDDWSMRLTCGNSTGGVEFFESREMFFPTLSSAGEFVVFDVGRIFIPAKIAGSPLYDVVFTLWAKNYTGFAWDEEDTGWYVYDIILIPTDEWAVDTLDFLNKSTSRLGNRRSLSAAKYLDVDPISEPKEVGSLVKYRFPPNVSQVSAAWRRIQNKIPIWHHRRDQKLHVFSMSYEEDGDEYMDVWYAHPCTSFSFKTYVQQRYYSLRGRR